MAIEIKNNRYVNLCVSKVRSGGTPLPSGHTMANFSKEQLEDMFALSITGGAGIVTDTDMVDEKYYNQYLTKFGDRGIFTRARGFNALKNFYNVHKTSDDSDLIVLFYYANGFTYVFNSAYDLTDFPEELSTALLAKVEVYFEQVPQT